jgi:tetratricopeptide (TPR) repeat protein
VYGILVDANVELGNYEEAVTISDKMQQLKPSLESYSRASYLREIYGDYNGAIEAMKLAVQAGLTGSEPQSWSRNILGDLYFNSGKLDMAQATYEENLLLRPSYAQSMAGLAKVAAKKQNYDRALSLLDSAEAIMQDNSFAEQKADVYTAMGDTAKAKAANASVQALLIADANTPQHSVALELGRSFIKTNQWDSASKYITQEYKVRPENIEVNSEMAWIAYNKNQREEAKQYMAKALRTGSKDPELLKRAATIKAAK